MRKPGNLILVFLGCAVLAMFATEALFYSNQSSMSIHLMPVLMLLIMLKMIFGHSAGKLYIKNPQAKAEAQQGEAAEAIIEDLESDSTETTTPTATFTVLVQDQHRRIYRTRTMGKVNLLNPPKVGQSIIVHVHPTMPGVVVPRNPEMVSTIIEPRMPAVQPGLLDRVPVYSGEPAPPEPKLSRGQGAVLAVLAVVAGAGLGFAMAGLF